MADPMGAMQRLGLTDEDFMVFDQDPQPMPGQAVAPTSGGAQPVPTPAIPGATPANPAADAMARLGLTDDDFATAAPPDVGFIEGTARHAAASATLNFADELEGVIRAASPSVTYDQGVAIARSRNDASPLASKIIGGVAGALAVPGLGTAGLVSRGATTAARIFRGAGAGLVEGAVAGAGMGEGGPVERLDEAATGAVIGAPLGAIGGVLSRVAEPIADTRLPMSKAQRTGDFSQFATEERLRNTGSSPMRAFDERQGAEIGQWADEIVPGGSVADESVRVADELGAARDALKAQERAAYKAFEGTEGFLHKDAGMDLHHRLVSVMDDPQKGRSLDPVIRDRTAKTLDEIRSTLIPEEATHVTLQQVEGVRKMLNRAISGASSDPAYKSAMVAIKSEYDDWMGDAVKSALYSGDDTALQKIRSARELSSSYRQLFGEGPGDRAGKMINALIADDATPEQAINMMFGLRKLGKVGTVPAIQRIRQASPDAMPHLQAAGWARMVRSPTGELKSPTMMAKAIDEHLNESPEMMRELYGEETLRNMRQFSRELRMTVTPRGATNPSGTSYRLMEMAKKITGPWTATMAFALDNATAGMASLLTHGGVAAKDYIASRAATALPKTGTTKPASLAGASIPLLIQQTQQP